MSSETTGTMNDSVEDEETKLRETIHRLRDEIERNPRSRQFGATAASLKHRRELQHELEGSFHRLAEVVETKRVEQVARHVVDSGMAQVAMDVGRYVECPLCLDEIPSWESYPFLKEKDDTTGRTKVFPCCGKTTCCDCSAKFTHAYDQAQQEAYQCGVDFPPVTCPFCRTPQMSSAEESSKLVLSNAEAGRVWAQENIGYICLLQSKISRNEDDEAKAVHWLTLAAQQGSFASQYFLGDVLYKGNSTSLPRCTEKGLELLLSAARHGHPMAQYQCSKILRAKGSHHDADAFIWCTLAAAQGHPDAQLFLGGFRLLLSIHKTVMLETDFNVLYWHKKAALQGCAHAQMCVSVLLLQLKRELFDGVPNLTGYSCLPEVFFWQRLARSSKDPRVRLMTPPDFGYNEDSCLQSCACCGKTGTPSAAAAAAAAAAAVAAAAATPASGRVNGSRSEAVKIHRCLQCRSVGYCSRECQRKHWNRGHKIDCQQVAALEEAMKA